MSLTVQFYTMVAMAAAGAWLGIAMDTFSRLLKRPQRHAWIRFVNDVLFWIVQALIIFYTLFTVNEGELRFFVILALLCGFAAYQSLMKSIYLKWLERIIQISIRIYEQLRRLFLLLIVRPIKLLLQLLLGLGIIILQFTNSTIIFIWKVVSVPIKGTGRLIWRMMPKKLINYLQRIAGIYRKIKNRLVKWMEKLRR